MTNILVWLIIKTLTMTTLLGAVQACLVIPREKQRHWDWRSDSSKMQIHSCDCGRISSASSSILPWTVFIHVQHKSSNTMKTCVGTIIASDLIATSHRCFLLSGKVRFRLYNALNFRWVKPESLRNIAGIDQLTVSSTKILQPHTRTFQVLKVIFNLQYLESAELQQFPEDDLALVKVNANFIADKTLNPICMPNLGANFDIGNVAGTFYGYSEEDDANNATLSDIPFQYDGEILKKADCYRKQNIHSSEDKQHSWKKTLCLQFGPGLWYLDGSPLVHITDSKIVYFMGIATTFTRDTSATELEALTSLDTVYFSSVLSLVSFIEHFGRNSVWCRIPKPNFEKFSGSIPVVKDINPWRSIRGPIERNENLDCVCGIANKPDSARIVGGVEATPKEFGWMAMMIVWPEGRSSPNASLCGGAIINDRMILTAAHCIVLMSKAMNKEPKVAVLAADIDVLLNNHLTHSDQEAIKVALSSVHFHSDYLPGISLPDSYYESDVAILVLKEALEFPKGHTHGIRPICVHKMGSYIPVIGKTATVAGWGWVEPNKGTMSTSLQKVEVPIADLSLCDKVAPGLLPLVPPDKSTLLCAGTLNRFKDSAPGDSGGPLMIKDEKSEQWTEVGIVSFGLDADDTDPNSETAAYYTDVQKVMSFIDYHSKRQGAKWCKTQ